MSWGASPPNQQPSYNPQYAQNPQGGYGSAPQGYGARPGGYGSPPQAAPQYGGPPPGAPPPGAYGQPPRSGPPGATPPGAYGQPLRSGPPGATPPGGYGQPPATSGPPGGYGGSSGYTPGGYGQPPPRSGPPGAYGAPSSSAPGYGQGYGAPPPSGPPGYAPGYGGGNMAPQPPPGVSPDLWQWFQPPPPQLPPGVSMEHWEWFQAVDADRSGKITAEELRLALHNGNWTPFNSETCRLMIGMFDRDKDGTIDVQEFAALWKYIQDWKGCFDRFDTDRSGNINGSELHNAFNSFGYRLSPQFCSLCVRVFDKHSANTMNFDCFIQCCVMLKSLTDQFQQKDTQKTGVVKIHYEEFLRMVLDNGMV